MLRLELSDSLDLRFYNIKNISFHPKGYIFKYENGGDIFVGSSNISYSALTKGIEWNYRIDKNINSDDYKAFKDVFEDLFNNHSKIIDDDELKRYSNVWRKPKIQDEVSRAEENDEKDNVIKYPRPIGAQIEALYELKKSREEGYDKGIIVAATGIGKTYLAAFDSKEYKKILFVAHREEILTQAAQSFKNLRQNSNCGFFKGDRKDKDVDVLFASVQTLGKEEYLNENYFKRDEFDYIIIDEFHHAVARNYSKIIDYFTPKFLLGLTATPERLDNKDVFALCDYNIIYEARLKDAINKGWLVPFRYYGIYDEVNYDDIKFQNGKYNEEELEQALMINKRSELILSHYKKYNSKRSLGFCTSCNHAEYMAKYFCDNGVPSACVISGDKTDHSMHRAEAISKLNSNDINVIFSVDMFNEGIDIPSIDMVMLLRPTESPTVFLQQLGRGLRKSSGKKYLNVLDFIGNYKKASLIPLFLSGDMKEFKKGKKRDTLPSEEDYPVDCIVDFDFRIIDIFKRQEKENQNSMDLIIAEYYRIKEDLKHRPSRLEMFTYLDNDIYSNIITKKQLNIFNNYLRFLLKLNELNEEELALMDTFAEKLINNIETTLMSKTYKMPLLLGFYNNGDFKLEIDEDEIYISFKNFYSKASNSIDLLRDKSTMDFENWGKSEYISLSLRNPQKFLCKSSGEFFNQKGSNFCLDDKLEEFKDDKAFIEHFKDVIDYKVRRFYKERLEKKKDLLEMLEIENNKE